LTDAIQGLDLFKDYKIATTMTYNRGEGDETSKLDEKPLRLELKKFCKFCNKQTLHRETK